MKIRVGARSSPLSRVQFEEFQSEFLRFHPWVVFEPVWAGSPGDRDKQQSLRPLEKTDFFTRDLDEMLLSGNIRMAIHSAKDLPDPLPPGIKLAALTKGVDPRDALVTRKGESFQNLRSGSIVATSSLRREERIFELRQDVRFVDLRGTIEERLAQLQDGAVDAVVVAEAALIRLGLCHLNRFVLPGETHPLQGRLAATIRVEDNELDKLLGFLETVKMKENKPCF